MEAKCNHCGKIYDASKGTHRTPKGDICPGCIRGEVEKRYRGLPLPEEVPKDEGIAAFWAVYRSIDVAMRA